MQVGGYSNGATAVILDDCYYLTTEFSKIEFVYNCHEANTVAHEIARYARSSDEQVWLDEPPDFLVPFLLNDVTLVMNE